MKRQYKSFDFLLCAAVLLLVVYGVIMIGSATHKEISAQNIKQIIFFGLGIILLLISAFIDYHFICKFYIIIYLFSIFLLAGVLVYGYLFLDNRVWRWYEVGPIKIQPSEFAKLFQIIFLSKYIDMYKEKINTPKVLLTLIATTALPIVLIIIQPSLSVSLWFMFISLCIIFLANIDTKIILTALGIVVPIGSFAYWDIKNGAVILSNVLFDHQLSRIMTFVNPVKDNKGTNYQTIQSIRAIASGQLNGKGLYKGLVTQFSNLPEAHTDFIFSVIGEELGFIGCMIAIALVFFIIIKCLLIAQNAADYLGRLIAVGVASMLMFQMFLNVSVAMGVLPNTGVPFPFVSYGGSSLWVSMIAIGLVINVKMTKTKSIFEG